MQIPGLAQGVDPPGPIEPAKVSLYSRRSTHKNYLNKSASSTSNAGSRAFTLMGLPFPRAGKRICLVDPLTHERKIVFFPVPLKDVDPGRAVYRLDPSEEDLRRAKSTYPPLEALEAQLKDALADEDARRAQPASSPGSTAAANVPGPVAGIVTPTLESD